MEELRLLFLEERDGPEETRVWARRTLSIYRQNIVKHDGVAKDRERRKLLVASCNCFRKYLGI